MKSAYTGIIGIIFCFMLLVQCAYAVPTTGVAVDINSSGMRFYATGVTNPVWFTYGTVSGNLIWKTLNSTNVSGGTIFLPQYGTPMMSLTKFYYKCCDATGCGAEQSSTLAAVTPAPTTTFGRAATNLSASHFDLSTIGGSLTEPYIWVTANPNIVFGLLLFFVFTGLWLRQREVILPIIVGMIGSGMILYSGAASVGIPPEFVIIAIGLVATGLTGVVFGLFKK